MMETFWGYLGRAPDQSGRGRAVLRNLNGEDTGLNQTANDLFCQAKQLDFILKLMN